MFPRITMTIQSCMLKCPFWHKWGFEPVVCRISLSDEVKYNVYVRRNASANKAQTGSPNQRLTSVWAQFIWLGTTVHAACRRQGTDPCDAPVCRFDILLTLIYLHKITQKHLRYIAARFLGNFELHLVDPYTLCHQRRPARSYRRPR